MMLRWLIGLVLCFGAGLAQANDFYNHGSYPTPGSPATSAGLRAELDLIAAGFDKLPSIGSPNANKLVVVNPTGTALTTLQYGITLSGSFATSGAYGLTLSLTGTTNITLPETGTVATLAGVEVLTNKELTSPTISNPTLTGSITGNISADGELTMTGTGSHSIGGSPDPSNQLNLRGTFVPGPTSWGSALAIRTVITGQVDQDAFGAIAFPTINKAASGTHNLFATLEIDPPVVGANSSTLNNAVSLYIPGTPSGGTNNYALLVTGASRFTSSTTFASGNIRIDGTASPHVRLNDGSTDAYLQISSSNLNVFTAYDLTLSAGSSEKARVSSGGMFLVGSSDTSDLASGGIGLENRIRFTEISDPSAPSSNRALLYARDDGSGNTQLVARFATGSVVPIATQGSTIAQVPTGAVFFTAASSAPTGYLTCSGAAVSRATYSTLYSTIGTTYGAGDGVSTFNLPNVVDRKIVAAGSAYINGNYGGESTHTLTGSEMPSHTHSGTTSSDGSHNHTATTSSDGSHNHTATTSTDGSHTHTSTHKSDGGGAAAGSGATGILLNDGSAVTGSSGSHSHSLTTSTASSHSHTLTTTTASAHSHSFTTGSSGSGSAHNVLDPYFALTCIIKT